MKDDSLAGSGEPGVSAGRLGDKGACASSPFEAKLAPVK